MQFRVLPAFVLFIGSYYPLALILLVQDIPKKYWEARVCNIFSQQGSCTFQILGHPKTAIVVAVFCFVAFLISMHTVSKIRCRFDVEVLDAKSVSNDLINYVFPYVVSFMGLSYSDPEKLAGFLVFLVWMFTITFKSGQIVMNPLLLLVGWRLYEATILLGQEKRTVRVLRKGRLLPGLYKTEVVQDFYFVGDR